MISKTEVYELEMDGLNYDYGFRAMRDMLARMSQDDLELQHEITNAGMRIVSGGTDNHLMLVDLRGIGVTGAEAETKMRAVGIVANKNMVPFDPNPPRVTSGVRVGVPAVTSRGMSTKDMDTIAELIVESLRVEEDSPTQKSLAKKVKEFASSFPVPGIDS